jgi:hypothetical protein
MVFSTSDVFDGMKAGLEMNGVEVVTFNWDHILRTWGKLVRYAVAGGLTEEKTEQMHQFTGWVASADAVTLAVDSEVDAAIVVNGLLFPPSRALVLRKLGIPVVCYGTEAPYFKKDEEQIAPFYTHWATNERRSVVGFAELTKAFYLPHAYNPLVHRPGAADPEKACDVVFVGGGYPERKALLEGPAWEGIGLQKRGTLWHLDLDAERGATDSTRRNRYSEGSIPNEETCAWHQSARVALNLHRRMAHIETGEQVAAGAAESLGPRAYEIPAVGGFELIDDERPEVWDVFGESAATFRAWDQADLIRQVRYWLSHPDERERCRKAQQEAVAPHHWGNRAKYLLECIIA